MELPSTKLVLIFCRKFVFHCSYSESEQGRSSTSRYPKFSDIPGVYESDHEQSNIHSLGERERERENYWRGKIEIKYAKSCFCTPLSSPLDHHRWELFPNTACGNCRHQDTCRPPNDYSAHTSPAGQPCRRVGRLQVQTTCLGSQDHCRTWSALCL